MKKLLMVAALGMCAGALFAQPITFKVSSYQIGGRQTAGQYSKAELLVEGDAESLQYSWEIILYRKDGAGPERIKLEKLDDIGRNIGVFRTVIIREGSGTAGSNLFAYVPVYEGSKIRIDLCDTKTEAVKRRLIIEY
jgi:hypothetical protein